MSTTCTLDTGEVDAVGAAGAAATADTVAKQIRADSERDVKENMSES